MSRENVRDGQRVACQERAPIQSHFENANSDSEFPCRAVDHSRNASLLGQGESMLGDGPKGRLELREDEADPLEALGTLRRTDRRQ